MSEFMEESCWCRVISNQWKRLGFGSPFLWRRRGGCDQLFDGLEDDLEVLVVFGVFRFEGFDFFREEGVGVHQAAELDEGAHDGDIYLHGAGRAQDAGEHGDALLGEGVGEGAATAAAV